MCRAVPAGRVRPVGRLVSVVFAVTVGGPRRQGGAAEQRQRVAEVILDWLFAVPVAI